MSGRPESWQGLSLLRNVRVVLVCPRFPENIGMAARACANMGLGGLRLVKPELWAPEHQEKALALATSQGEALARGAVVADSLSAAVADCNFVLGTTARTGGWRRRIISPQMAGEKIAARLAEGQTAALVFGPEDRGLVNAEIELCTAVASIPTAVEASSLNLAQAVLILGYECLKSAGGLATAKRDSPTRENAADDPAGPGVASNFISHAEQEMLFAAMAKVLKSVDFLPQDNSDYFLLPLREFMHSRPLKRGEFSMLMGVCRQITWALERDRAGRGEPKGAEPL